MVIQTGLQLLLETFISLGARKENPQSWGFGRQMGVGGQEGEKSKDV